MNEFQEVKKGDGTPFKVYSPFWKNSERIFLEKIPNKDHKVKKLKKIKKLFKKNISCKNILPNKDWYKKFDTYWQPSESTAKEHLEKFIKNDADAVFVINGFLKSLAETLSDLSLTYSSGNGILLAGSLIRSLYPYIDKKAFIENFMANKYQSHKKMLELVSIGVITKERTPLYGNLGFFKNLNKI